MIRQVNTKNGTKFVQSFPASAEFWNITNRPKYVSSKKNEKGQWWVTVWGDTKNECVANVRELAKMQHSAQQKTGRFSRGSSGGEYCYGICPVSGKKCCPENGPCHDCE